MLRVPIVFAALTVARNTAQSAAARHRATPRRYARGHMRLAQMRVLDRRVAAVRRGESWHALASDDLGALVRSGAAALRQAADQASPEPLANPVPEAPLRPGKIVAIGLNYLDHIREAGLEAPAAPLVFAKFPSSVIGPDEAIVFDATLTSRVDWEVELAVVIGSPLRNVTEDGGARRRVGLYGRERRVRARPAVRATANGRAARASTRSARSGPRSSRPTRSATRSDSRLRTRVNGETVQDSSTAQMLFGVAQLLAYCSRELHARARRRAAHRHALGMRRVHEPAALASSQATSSRRGGGHRRPAQPGQISPRRIATATACARSRTSSLR